jgi:putative phosphoesterase
MLLGILSDTHDRLDATRAGLAALQKAGAQYFIHCGDVGGEEILDQLAGLPAAFVWGNNDYDRTSLAAYAQTVGVQCLHIFGELELGNQRIAVTHGDDTRLVKQLLARQAHDYLLLGHSHVLRDERVGRMRIINPGALHRAARKTVATLDLASDSLRLIEVSV